MKKDNQKEDWRVYNTSREFSKDIKFNKKWYHLTALFDKDQDSEDFDFNDVPEPQEFDFNRDIDLVPIYEPDQYLNSIEFDFNSVLMEKYKITEIGLIMSELNEAEKLNMQKITKNNLDNIADTIIGDNNLFKNFYHGINKYSFGKGFYVKTALEIFSKNETDTDKLIASINDQSQLKDNAPLAIKNILATILKNGGGYTNETIISILSSLDPKKLEENSHINLIKLLSCLTIHNMNNPMAFPDAVFQVDENDNNKIPVDLKVAYNGNFSAASSSNARLMTGIYYALKNAINKGVTLMQYISESKLSNMNLNYKEIKNNTPIIPELKGFLLISSTQYDFNEGCLNYNDICIKPIIACIHGRSNIENDALFATKSRRATGSISYDNGDDTLWENAFAKDWKDKGILKGCPDRFAKVIYNFYKCLVDNYDEKIRGKYDHLLTFLTFTKDGEQFNEEAKERYKQDFIEIFKKIDPNFIEK